MSFELPGMWDQSDLSGGETDRPHEHACPSCQGVQTAADILEFKITETREPHWICCFCGTASPVHQLEVCV